jgi:hypothetical protein
MFIHAYLTLFRKQDVTAGDERWMRDLRRALGARVEQLAVAGRAM